MNGSGVGVNAFGTSAAENNSLDNSLCYDSFGSLEFSQPDGIMGDPSQLGVNITGSGFPNQLESPSVSRNPPSHHSLNTISHGTLRHCTLPFQKLI